MEQMLFAKILRSYDPKYVVDDESDNLETQRARKLQVSRALTATKAADRLTADDP